MQKKIIKLATHSGGFHADDVFSTATFLLKFGENAEVEIFRTRDSKIIESADFVYDVGGLYDPENNLFDHHQINGAGLRENGIPYSSFGLVWKKFGAEVCGSEKIAKLIEEKFVQSVDAMDNGVEIYKTNNIGLHPYLFSDLVNAYNPIKSSEKEDILFKEIVDIAKKILCREIEKFAEVEKTREIVEAIYRESEDKRIIIFDKKYPFECIIGNYPEPLFVIYPKENKEDWAVKSVRDDFYSFKNRKNFPDEWAGKNGDDLIKATGVNDALFCHNGKFLCVAKSKDGAVALARLAVGIK